MTGIIGYGSYVPHWRIQRGAIAAALGGGRGSGGRTVASWDEDTATMGVEAARWATHGRELPADGTLLFATSNPPYLEKTNATALHAALRLPVSWSAFDVGNSVRSAGAALRAGIDAVTAGRQALVVLSDIRTGAAGSADEAAGGDAAAALLLGRDDAVATIEAMESRTLELLDRWRSPGTEVTAWDERFVEHVYVPLVEEAVGAALERAGVGPGEVLGAVVTGAHARLTSKVVGALKLRSLRDGLADEVGNTGVADPGLHVAAALDAAGAGETIVLAHVADGVDVVVLRTTDLLVEARSARPVAAQLADSDNGLSYIDMVSWRGNLRREPARRAEPAPPAATVSHRRVDWKFALAGSRCTGCSTMHLPPQIVCRRCGAVSRMTDESAADKLGTIATFAIDRLAESPAGAQVSVVVDFDGGGRLPCAMTDVNPDEVAIGQRVRMSFRRLYTSQRVHNYFWKATPAPISQQR